MLMAHKARRPRRRSIVFVMHPERFGVEVRLHIPRMAVRHGGIERSGVVLMARLAVGHPDSTWYPGCVVALHAVDHLGQGQIRDTGAPGDRVMTGRAIQVELVFDPEVSSVREIDIHILPRCGLVPTGETPRFGEAWILDFFGRMATPATFGRKCSRKLWLDAGLGVACRALVVVGEHRELTFGVEFMTKRAVRAETGFSVDSRLGIHMLVVGKLEQNRT